MRYIGENITVLSRVWNISSEATRGDEARMLHRRLRRSMNGRLTELRARDYYVSIVRRARGACCECAFTATPMPRTVSLS